MLIQLYDHFGGCSWWCSTVLTNTKTSYSLLSMRTGLKTDTPPFIWSESRYAGAIERKPTVMFIRTFILVWSKRTVTECIPSSTTTTVRGKRKKATSAEARRHNTTEMTTYSFLQHRNMKFLSITSTLQAWTTCKYHFILSTSEVKRESSHRNRVFKITTKVSWVHISRFTSLTFFGAAAFGHCMGSMQPVHSLDLSEER